MDPDVLKKFETQYNIKVRMLYFDSDDQRDNILVDSHGGGYDVILSSDESLRRYRKAGWLSPITETQVPNLKYIKRKWIDEIEPK